MALLVGHQLVSGQPVVYDGNEIPPHRIALWLHIRQIVLVPVSAVSILADSLKAVIGHTGNFS